MNTKYSTNKTKALNVIYVEEHRVSFSVCLSHPSYINLINGICVFRNQKPYLRLELLTTNTNVRSSHSSDSPVDRSTCSLRVQSTRLSAADHSVNNEMFYCALCVKQSNSLATLAQAQFGAYYQELITLRRTWNTARFP